MNNGMFGNIPHRSGGYPSSNHNSPPDRLIQTSPTHVPTTFLFVAHEFYIESADPQADGDHEEDCWGFKCPPTDARAYGEPFRSEVLRYTDGRISRAPEYEWINGPPRSHSFVKKVASHAKGKRTHVTHFDTASVWSCGHPVVVVRCDASKTPTVRRDATTSLGIDSTFGHSQRWSLLHFWHPRLETDGKADLIGVSQAMTRYGRPTGDESPGSRSIHAFVAGGGSPGWLGPLVPDVFRNPRKGAPESHGLGGMLTVLIGLMALAGCEHRRPRDGDIVTPMFAPKDGGPGLWDGHRWRGPTVPRGFLTHYDDHPRGFLVQVFLDDIDNPNGSTTRILEHLQWNTVLVHEEN